MYIQQTKYTTMRHFFTCCINCWPLYRHPHPVLVSIVPQTLLFVLWGFFHWSNATKQPYLQVDLIDIFSEKLCPFLAFSSCTDHYHLLSVTDRGAVQRPRMLSAAKKTGRLCVHVKLHLCAWVDCSEEKHAGKWVLLQWQRGSVIIRHPHVRGVCVVLGGGGRCQDLGSELPSWVVQACETLRPLPLQSGSLCLRTEFEGPQLLLHSLFMGWDF